MLPVAPIDVQDVETAVTLRFLWYPSIRVSGMDIEPGRECQEDLNIPPLSFIPLVPVVEGVQP